MANVAAPQMSPTQLNSLQRQAVLQSAVPMCQAIYSQQINPANQNIVNIPVRNVGLLTNFIVEITGSITDADAALDLTITDFGLANVLSQITFTDLNNNVRIQTSGRHLHLINTAKERKSYGTAIQQDTAFGAGVSWPITSYTSPVVHGAGAKNFRMVYNVPIAYSPFDLRGAIYANVVNATMNLQLSINTANFVVLNTGDTSQAVYTATGAGGVTNSTLGTMTITVYQEYLDQLPTVMNQGKPQVVLPVVDLATIYELKTSKFSPLTVGTDYQLPYANFRDFLSTHVVYVTDGSTRKSDGTDLNYIALQSANFTNIFKIDPLLAAQKANKFLNVAQPAGSYYFDTRQRPISTTQYGNMALVLNPALATVASFAQVSWEDFALQNTLATAASLPGPAM